MASSPIQKSMDYYAGGGGGGGGLKSFPDDPCTDRCRSKQHGKRIWDIALAGEESAVVCLWSKTCLNYANVKDEFGRNALHAAASTGNLKGLEWIIKTQQCNINAKDFISGYTPLHRAVYFGQFHIARSLIKHGADINIRDNEGLTPFELCQNDRPKPFIQHKGDMTELTVWGSNANYNLGLGHQQPRIHPDVVTEFRRADMSLSKVEMNTYHTIFLTQSGKVYGCGYGMGGRCGTGEEDVVLSPCRIHLKNNGPCRDVAVGLDHSIFLTETKIWTVGSNEFGQLGHVRLATNYLKNPRTVDSLQRYGIEGVFAGNYHSGFYNEETVLMCGLNQGQFGRGFEDQATVPVPSKLRLTLDNVGNGPVTSVGGNDFCTAVCIAKSVVFLLRKHQCIKIDSKNTTSNKILKIQASGDKNNIALFLLTTSGRILVWRENLRTDSKGAFTRIVFSGGRLLDVKDFSVSLNTLVVIASTGEAYKAGWSSTNAPTIIGRIEGKFGQVASADFQIAGGRRGGRKDDDVPFLELELMRVKRVPNVFTALSVSSDAKGNNFAILQRHPMMDVTDIPMIIETNITEDLKSMYMESDQNDNICDVTFQTDSYNSFGGHRLILASASPILAEVFDQNRDSESEVITVTNKLFSIDPSKCASLEDPKTFRALLDMIYTRQCCYLTVDFMVSCLKKEEGKRTKGKYADELFRFKALMRAMGMAECESLVARCISDLEIQMQTINANASATVNDEDLRHLLKLNQCLNEPAPIIFPAETRASFADVILESSDKVRFDGNKCMLVARLQYFKSLFSANWLDTTMTMGNRKISEERTKILLPFSSKAIAILLEWLYTNNADSLLKEADLETICETLGLSDYVMADNLIRNCECEIVSRINLKNAVDILIFASQHNGSQLKHTCFDFISVNATAMLENRLLDAVPVPLMRELNEYYRKMLEDHRFIVRDLEGCGQPPDNEEYEVALREAAEEMLENLEVIEDADQATMVMMMPRKNPNKGGRSRVRLRSRTYSESESISIAEQKDQALENDQDKGRKSLDSSGDDFLSSSQAAIPATGPAPVAVAKVNSKSNQKLPTKLIVPLPNNNTSIQLEEFPSLGLALSSAPTSVKLAKAPHPPKKTGPPPSNASPPPSQPQPSTSGYSNGAGATPNRASTSGPSPGATTGGEGSPVPATKPKPSPAASSSSSSGGRKKTKWRTIKSESDIVVPRAEEGAVGGLGVRVPSITADGRDRNNPWRTNSPKSQEPMEVVFQAIVEDEVEKKRNFQNAISKPFQLMQIEDEVIDFLTARYSSQDTYDYIELLSVERVGSSNFSAPTWVQHPGAVNASFPAQSLASPTTAN